MSAETPIEVWILGGYLGAGKTTALNAILAGPFADSSPALIINEFGRIGVDGALVQRQELRRFEINKGSLFCICTKTDFLKALAEIAADRTHQTVLIEATGIAEPVDIESFLKDGPHAGQFQLRGNICIVDAAHFTQVAAYLKPATSQVHWADAIIINKCDLVCEHELTVLRQLLTSLNPIAPTYQTSFGQIKNDFLKQITRHPRQESLRPCAPEQIYAASFTAQAPIDPVAFNRTVSQLSSKILRFKGNVAFTDGPAYVEIVCGQYSQKPPQARLSHQTAPTAFSVIAWDIEKETLKQAFIDCGCKAA